jgi:hypothetical protein
MNFVDHIAEKKIAEAIARGELSDLPGQGAPLALDDDSLIPQELRMAYRILRNAGFVPPEVTVLREISDLERRIEGLPQDGARARALRKLQLLRMRLESGGRFRATLGFSSPYADQLLDRFEREGGGLSAAIAPDSRKLVG